MFTKNKASAFNSTGVIIAVIPKTAKILNTFEPIKFPKENTYFFDPNKFSDAKGRLRAILVFKKTRWDLKDEGNTHYSSYIDELDREDMLAGHNEHLRSLEHVRSILRENNVDFIECFRSELTDKLANNRLVITVGGDGTLLSLLRALYQHYSKVELPPIAAFNLVSIFQFKFVSFYFYF